jgi:hypothetical protein
MLSLNLLKGTMMTKRFETRVVGCKLCPTIPEDMRKEPWYVKRGVDWAIVCEPCYGKLKLQVYDENGRLVL